MKKTLGALLTLSLLVGSAACATSRGPSQPTPQQPDPGETWSLKRPVGQPGGFASAPAPSAKRLATR